MFRLGGSTVSGEGTAHHMFEGKMRNIILREKEFRFEMDGKTLHKLGCSCRLRHLLEILIGNVKFLRQLAFGALLSPHEG